LEVAGTYTAPSLSFGPLGPTMLLVPMMMFYLLWPNWGTTLYGEIRGASDFRRVLTGMMAGLWTTVALSVVFLLLFAKTFGWAFYQSVNADWGSVFGKNALPIFPYPVLMASWIIHNTVLQVILLLLMSLWFFGWVGTLFLSSTRVIFAAAFDRVLPDAAAQVSEKRRVPVASLFLMLLPAVGLGALYAYNSTFHSYTLDATLVIAVTYPSAAQA
jgi:amino acid transporter